MPLTNGLRRLVVQHEQVGGENGSGRVGATRIVREFDLEHARSKLFDGRPHVPAYEAPFRQVPREGNDVQQLNLRFQHGLPGVGKQFSDQGLLFCKPANVHN